MTLVLALNNLALDTFWRTLPPPRQEDAESGKTWAPSTPAYVGAPSASLLCADQHGRPASETILVSIIEMTSLLRKKGREVTGLP